MTGKFFGLLFLCMIICAVLGAHHEYMKFFNLSALIDGTVWSSEKYARNVPQTIVEFEFAGVLLFIAAWIGLTREDDAAQKALGGLYLAVGVIGLLARDGIRAMVSAAGYGGFMYEQWTVIPVVLSVIGFTLLAIRPLSVFNLLRVALFSVAGAAWVVFLRRWALGDLAALSNTDFLFWCALMIALVFVVLVASAGLTEMAARANGSARSPSAGTPISRAPPVRPSTPATSGSSASPSSGPLPDAVARAVQAVRDEKK